MYTNRNNMAETGSGHGDNDRLRSETGIEGGEGAQVAGADHCPSWRQPRGGDRRHLRGLCWIVFVGH